MRNSSVGSNMGFQYGADFCNPTKSRVCAGCTVYCTVDATDSRLFCALSTVDSTRDLNGYCCNPRFLCDSASQVLLITLEFTVNSVGYGSLHFLKQQG